MFLDAVRNELEIAPSYTNGFHREPAVYKPWSDWEPSPIAHHGGVCCELAREWIGGTDFSLLNGSNVLTGPRWLRERFGWGPTVYPIHWCGVLKRSSVDCGVHAALAHEVFTNRGVRSFRAQLVQKFSNSAAAQWRSAWEDGDAVTEWINGDVIYHEGCAVVTANDSIKIWDPSAAWWIDPKASNGYGSLLAVRISSHGKTNEVFGRLTLPANIWVDLADADTR